MKWGRKLESRKVFSLIPELEKNIPFLVRNLILLLLVLVNELALIFKKLDSSKETTGNQFYYFFKNNIFICCSLTVSTTNRDTRSYWFLRNRFPETISLAEPKLLWYICKNVREREVETVSDQDQPPMKRISSYIKYNIYV